MPDINSITLSNGLKLITIRKDSRMMAVNLGFRTGSMKDPKGKKGLSHFLEHMLFTGTEKRSHDELNSDFEFLGGDVNAFTDLTQLIFSVSALTEEMDRSLELLSDIAQHPNFTPEETEREKQVILSEYKEGLEDLETTSFDLLYAKGWPGEPLKFDVIGDQDSIGSLTLEDLKAHKNRYLNPGNAVLTIASPLEHEEMRNAAVQYFADWKAAETPVDYIEDSKNQPGTWETETDNSEMATVCLVYSFPKLPDSDKTALKVLNRRLGDSDNSLLFREIRLKRGLSYDIYSNLDLTPHVKTLEIYCATDSEHIHEVAEIIEKITADIKSGVIAFSPKDLELTLKMHRTNIAALMDDTQGLCGYVTANALDGLPLLNYEKELAEMELVTVDDLKRLANSIFVDPTISLMLPRPDADEEDPEGLYNDEYSQDGVDDSDDFTEEEDLSQESRSGESGRSSEELESVI